MKALATLIRLHGHQLDGKRQALAAAEERLAKAQADLVHLDEEMATELQQARDVYESTYTYGAYLAEARLRRAVIEACIKMLQDEARKAHDEVAEAFAELKKYEITQENRDRQAQEEANRREQDSLDEMGLAMFRRKNNE